MHCIRQRSQDFWGSSSWMTSMLYMYNSFIFIIILLFLFLKNAQSDWGWDCDVPIKFKYLTWDTQDLNFWACHALLMSFQLHLVFWTGRTPVFSVGDTDCISLSTKCNIGSLLLHLIMVHPLSTSRVPSEKCCPSACDPHRNITLALYHLPVASASGQKINYCT